MKHKQGNFHTKIKRVSKDENKWYLPFLEHSPSPYFTNSSLFKWNIWTPFPSSFLGELKKEETLLYKGVFQLWNVWSGTNSLCISCNSNIILLMQDCWLGKIVVRLFMSNCVLLFIIAKQKKNLTRLDLHIKFVCVSCSLDFWLIHFLLRIIIWFMIVGELFLK